MNEIQYTHVRVGQAIQILLQSNHVSSCALHLIRANEYPIRARAE